MDEKETKILEAFRELRDHGFSELHVDIREDGKFLITCTKKRRSPDDLQVQDAIDNTLAWGFGSVEVEEIGHYRFLKQIKRYKV